MTGLSKKLIRKDHSTPIRFLFTHSFRNNHCQHIPGNKQGYNNVFIHANRNK